MADATREAIDHSHGIFRHKDSNGLTTDAIDRNDFSAYQHGIIHSWLRAITALTFILVPLFFVLDIFIIPRNVLVLFAIYRAVSTLLALAQHLVVRNTKPSRLSFLHGYFVSLQVGGIIAAMIVHLGGFESGYYPGLIMVIIGVNLLMPWRATHTAANCILILLMYVGFNLLFTDSSNGIAAANNLFFLVGTSVISVAINHVRFRLIQTEFSLLVQLKQARDALWSEMELAKRVQTTLLPRRLAITGYDVAVAFSPAREVGGDYYDIIETKRGDRYVTIGDVAGHGLDSGLIMMMAQTAVSTVVRGHDECAPGDVLKTVNSVLRENVGRLGSNHYMTMIVMQLADDHITVAGHHQDVLVYRRVARRVETIATKGSWLGIADNLDGFVDGIDIPIAGGDCVLLFSDGVTEAESQTGELYGQERLTQAFARVAPWGAEAGLRKLQEEIDRYQHGQSDDMTVIMVSRRIPQDGPALA